MEQNSKKDAAVTLAVLLVVVVIVVAAVVSAKKRDENATSGAGNNPTASETTSTPPDATTPNGNGSTSNQNATNATFRDGVYNATGQYSTPDGAEAITVSVTLKDGDITDASAQGTMRSRESREYVSAFLDAYKSYVVGKRIDGLALSRVSGSSLTSQGFNRALQEIRNESQA